MSGAVNQSGLSRVYNWLAGIRQRPGMRRAFSQAWPSPCLVCGEACDGRPPVTDAMDTADAVARESTPDGLCLPCADALPWNRQACDGCALPLPDGETASRCGRCLRRPPPLDACHAAFVYGFPLDRLLPRAKFHGDLAAGHRLGGWMAAALAPVLAAGGRPDAVVPVPLHRGRLRRRGYDQALELARPLAARLGLPLHDGLLRRVRATGPQSRLDAAGRRRNLRDAFAVDAHAGPPAHVVLVDDVMTTGATLHAAATALRRAGAARVDAWVCARVP